MSRRSGLALVVGVLCLAIRAFGQAGDTELAEAEAALKKAGHPVTDEGLVQFFRKRTLSEADRQTLERLVVQLGDDDFEARERATTRLGQFGVAALPILHRALATDDVEIVERARACLKALPAGESTTVPMAALRVLSKRRPTEALEAVLAYLPCAGDSLVEDEAIAAVGRLGLKSGKAEVEQAILGAADDPHVLRRVAAATALARSSDGKDRCRKLLDDPHPRVRSQAAIGLFEARDKAAVPALIRLLDDGEAAHAWQSEDLLCRLAGDDRPNATLDLASPDSRRKCRDAWNDWWKSHADSVDLARVQLADRFLGLTLVCDLDKGAVIEFGPDRKERWRVAGFRGPIDAQVLSNGNVLVAENHARCVTERDRAGKIVWEKKLVGYAASCQRLPNGNTFIVGESQVLEVNRDGREILSLDVKGGLISGRKLRGGQIVLLSSSGRVSFRDSTGKELRTMETGGVVGWSSFDVLANGHILACCADGKVVEFDEAGKRVWQAAVPNATSCRRLHNGSTLVSDSEGRRIVELDRAGKITHEIRLEGRSWHVSAR